MKKSPDAFLFANSVMDIRIVRMDQTNFCINVDRKLELM